MAVVPKVSIIMPVYNAETYLDEALRSISVQTFRDFEIIVICECGSNRATTELLEAYGGREPRLRILYNEKRLGISASLNRGLKEARGDYIARMDADDISLPNRIQTQVEFMEAHPDVTILGARVAYIDARGRSFREKDCYPQAPSQIRSDLMFWCCVSHPTVMFRREAMQEAQLCYDESLFASEDYDLWARACHEVKLANYPEVLLKYRWYQGNATHANDREGVANYLRIMARTFERLGLSFTADEINLLCPLTCTINRGNRREALQILDSCQSRILDANRRHALYDVQALQNTLHQRFYWHRHPIRFQAAITIRSLAKVIGSKRLLSLANYLELNGFFSTVKRSLINVIYGLR